MSGSAWTNQVVSQVIIAGTIPGLLTYSPKIGFGNLIGSISATATTDPSGNAVLAGITGYSNSAGVYYAANMGPALGGASVISLWTAPSAAGPYTNQGGIGSTNAGNMTIGAPGSVTLNSVAGSLIASRDASSYIGYLTSIQTDVTTRTNANLVPATALSAQYTIDAGTLAAGTWYTIEMPYNAVMEATNTLELGLSIDGSASFTVNDTLSAAIVGAGIGVHGVIRVILECTVVGGVTGRINAFVDGTTGQTGATATFANRGSLTGAALAVALDTTVSHTIQVNSLWGGSTAGQTVSGTGSKCIREGP